MPIIQATDSNKDRWNDFVKLYALDGGLLQSWEWADFQKSLGNKIYRLILLDNAGNYEAACLLIKHELVFEYNYLYCPRGPVAKKLDSKKLKILFDEIKKITSEEKSFMLRLDPPWPVEGDKILAQAGLRKSEQELQPKCNFVIGIANSEGQILSAFKPKTRYNISLAQKKGVQVNVSTESSDIENFWLLLKETSERDGFKTHLKEHYLKMFEILAPANLAKLYFAQYDGKVIAAILVSFFGQFATYLHGGSSNLYREVMGPYLLHWQAIKDAKSLNCNYYDFGGVNAPSFQSQKWEGITRFKTGFGQNQPIREYVGGYEMVLNPVVFAAYKFVKQIRG